MYKQDLSLGPEWSILELLCLGLSTPEEQGMFGALVRSDQLRWGELLEQALRHRMATLLAYHLSSTNLIEVVPKRIAENLRSVLDLNRYTRFVWYNEAVRVVKALEARGVAVAGRKQASFESTIYGGNGSRRMGDIDFLILPEDREAVKEVMLSLNYQIGLYDWKANSVVPFARRELIEYQLNADHLPVFSIVTGDPIVCVMEVDFANSFTWARSPYNISVGTALAAVNSQPIRGMGNLVIPCLTPMYQFIDTTLHLFKEAWLEAWLGIEQDVDLMKFGDVARLWGAYRQDLIESGFAQIIYDLGIADPIIWVLEHLDRVLQHDIVPALGLANRVQESWLSSARTSGGTLRTWKGTMRERLHCKDRRSLFVDAT